MIGATAAISFFSEDCFEAKTRFCERVHKLGGRLESLPLESKGPRGESLTIDVAPLDCCVPAKS